MIVVPTKKFDLPHLAQHVSLNLLLSPTQTQNKDDDRRGRGDNGGPRRLLLAKSAAPCQPDDVRWEA